MTPLRQRMLDELQRRNYSPATTRDYIHAIKQFAEYFHKSPEQLGGDEIRQFELHLLKEKKLAPGTVEGRMSALRFLYKKVLKRRDIAYDDLIFPKVPRKLPVVLSPEEVTRMIDAAPSLLHRTILMVLYATGMRRTEASLLKIADIDSERMVIHIHQGKGSREPILGLVLSHPVESIPSDIRESSIESQGYPVHQHAGVVWLHLAFCFSALVNFCIS